MLAHSPNEGLEPYPSEVGTSDISLIQTLPLIAFHLERSTGFGKFIYPLSVKLAAVRWSKDRRFGLEFIKMDRPEQQILDALMAEQPASNSIVMKGESTFTRT